MVFTQIIVPGSKIRTIIFRKKSKKIEWTEETDQELTTLYNEYLAMEEKPFDNVIDFVKSKFSLDKRPGTITKHLRRLGFDVGKTSRLLFYYTYKFFIIVFF